MPPAEKFVWLLPVLKFARFASPGALPASITYELAGSPAAGALQSRNTVLPLAETTRFPGAAGATSAPPVVLAACSVAGVKHPAAPSPCRQRAKSTRLAAAVDAVGIAVAANGAAACDSAPSGVLHAVSATAQHSSEAVRMVMKKLERGMRGTLFSCSWGRSCTVPR